MRKLSLLIIVFVLANMLSAQSAEREIESTYRPGEMIVMLHHDAKVDQLVASNPTVDLKAAKRVTPNMNMWLLTFDPARIGGEELKASLAMNTAVQIVQFNHNNIVLKSVTPNDSLYSLQWDMDKISAPQAWALDTGGYTADSTRIVVASIDGGFEISHPDLNPWHNLNEIPGNGIDDDHNGYIDDYNGWNASLSTDSIEPGNGHGTATIGISSAHGNNGKGICGVSWNVQAMPVCTNIYNETTVIAAYAYVFKQRKLYNETSGAKGAFVVSTNSSFGPAGTAAQYPLWNAMYDSMGIVGILSAGATSNDPNCNTDTCPDIPSQCPSTFTVIATGTNAADVRHGGYGLHNVDIAAPGNGSYTINAGATYGGFGGTSAASPHIAGAIALMWAAACPKMLNDYKLHPDSLALVMKQYLLNGVDTLSDLVGKTVSGGRLNLFKAVSNVKTYDCTTVTQPSGVASVQADRISIYPNPTESTITVNSGVAVKSIKLYDALGQRLLEDNQSDIVDMTAVPAGIYMLEVTDVNGINVIKKVVKK